MAWVLLWALELVLVPLHFKRTDVDSTIHNTIKAGPALIVDRRRSKARAAAVNRRATR